MKNPIIKFSKFIFSLLLVLLIFTVNVNSQTKKNILYISSGAATYSSTQDQMEGFNDAIRNNYEVYFEYLNTIKYPNKEHEDAFYSLLKSKLEIYPKFDAIVLSDDATAMFAIKHKQLFKDTPIFLTSVNNNEVINKAKELGIECIVEENLPISQNLEIIGDIYSKNNNKLNFKNNNKLNLVLITGPDDIYKKEIEEFYSLKNKYKRFNFKNVALSFKNEKDITDKLKEFNKNKDVLFFLMPISYSSSKKVSLSDTNFNSMNQIIKAIKDSTNAPIFTTSKRGVESGMIGGYTVDLYKQGKITGTILNEFLGGEKSRSNILVKADYTNSLVFNYKEMIKHGIRSSIIPKDAEIVSKSDSILSKYKNIIIIFTIISFIITIFIFTRHIITIKSNKKLKEAKKIAEDANRLKDDFIANISHELRTPVNVISSTAQLMKINLDNKDINIEKINSNINMIEQNTHRLTRLISNIIDVTKSDNGEKSLILQNVEIIGLIENSVLSVVPFAESKNINVIFDTEHEELIMSVDIDKIDRIILNLLSNAIKFSYNGCDVLVNLSCDKDHLIIEVTDFGVGISDENIDLIFEKFTQIDNRFTRLNEGSGIGLSLVKSFVNMHKGSIEVKSKLGKGTTFKVLLPIHIIEKGKVVYNGFDANNTSIELSDIYI